MCIPYPCAYRFSSSARISTKVGKPAIGWIGLFHTGQDQIDDGISQIEISGIQSVEAGELDLDIGLAVAVHVALDQRQIVGCVELIAQLGGLRRALCARLDGTRPSAVPGPCGPAGDALD